MQKVLITSVMFICFVTVGFFTARYALAFATQEDADTAKANMEATFDLMTGEQCKSDCEFEGCNNQTTINAWNADDDAGNDARYAGNDDENDGDTQYSYENWTGAVAGYEAAQAHYANAASRYTDARDHATSCVNYSLHTNGGDCGHCTGM